MIRYFARLTPSKLIVWCYLAWYAAIVSQYFEVSRILWISSAGIAFMIGLSACAGVVALHLVCRLAWGRKTARTAA